MKKINPYKRNINVNYGFTFFLSFNLTHGFWMIYLASKGMSLVQLGILEGIFHITSFLMETPTGAIADIFGRKTSRILSRFFLIAYILLTLYGTTFAHFALSFVLCAVGWNLESGAGDALVYDSLIETGDEARFMKVKGIEEVIYQSAQGLALLIGGFIAVKSYQSLYLSQVFIIVVAVLLALFFRETQIDKVNRVKTNILAAIKEQYIGSFQVVKGNRRLIYFISFINALGIFTTTTFFYMQIYCKENGVNEGAIGILFAVAGAIGALGGFFAYRLEGFFKEKRLLFLLPVLFMLLMWGMASFRTAIVSFLLMGFIDSLMFVVYSEYINRMLPSDRRATLLSFSSMVFSFFMLFLFPAFGWIGEHFRLEVAFGATAVVATILAFINFVLLLKHFQSK